MALIAGYDKACVQICDALGLKHVVRFDLHMALNEVVTANVEYYPEKDGITELHTIFRQFVLVRKPKHPSILYHIGMWLIDRGSKVRNNAGR